MKKIYFTDIGLRNIILNDFQDIEYRHDKGALFENFVYLEVAKELIRPENIFFYRTKDGLEIDFLLNTTRAIIPFESKFQSFKRPQGIPALKKFKLIEPFDSAYLVNKDLGATEDDVIFIPGFFLSKVTISWFLVLMI